MNRLILIAFLVVLASCYYDKYHYIYPSYSTSTGCDTTATYSGNVQTVFSNYCVSCHNPGYGSNGGILLDNYTNAKTNAQAALKAMVGTTVEPMPKGAQQPLYQTDSCSVHIIRVWIQKGYPN